MHSSGRVPLPPPSSCASAVSYLERYTLKAILGVSEQEDDDDGNGGGDIRYTWLMKVNEAKTSAELDVVVKQGVKVFQAARDAEGYSSFQRSVMARRQDFKLEEAGHA